MKMSSKYPRRASSARAKRYVARKRRYAEKLVQYTIPMCAVRRNESEQVGTVAGRQGVLLLNEGTHSRLKAALAGCLGGTGKIPTEDIGKSWFFYCNTTMEVYNNNNMPCYVRMYVFEPRRGNDLNKDNVKIAMSDLSVDANNGNDMTVVQSTLYNTQRFVRQYKIIKDVKFMLRPGQQKNIVDKYKTRPCSAHYFQDSGTAISLKNPRQTRYYAFVVHGGITVFTKEGADPDRVTYAASGLVVNRTVHYKILEKRLADRPQLHYYNKPDSTADLTGYATQRMTILDPKALVPSKD